jgi:hypothetical protein
MLHAEDGECVVTCLDGNRLALVEARDDEGPIDLPRLLPRLEAAPFVVS